MASKGTDEKLEHLRPNRGLKVGCFGITACRAQGPSRHNTHSGQIQKTVRGSAWVC